MKTASKSALLTISSGVLAALALAAGIYVLPLVQDPQDFSTWATVPLRNGPNEIDIDGDGHQDLVFVAWRDNANAHGYDRVTFYWRNSDDQNWQIVPFDDRSGQPGEDSFRTNQGADCRLRGIAIVRKPSPPGEAVTAVVGERDFGQSYADAANVKFGVYRIARKMGFRVGLACISNAIEPLKRSRNTVMLTRPSLPSLEFASRSEYKSDKHTIGSDRESLPSSRLEFGYCAERHSHDNALLKRCRLQTKFHCGKTKEDPWTKSPTG
jgi:hypothetical protein